MSTNPGVTMRPVASISRGAVITRSPISTTRPSAMPTSARRGRRPGPVDDRTSTNGDLRVHCAPFDCRY